MGKSVTHKNIDETMQDVNVSALSKVFTGKPIGEGKINYQKEGDGFVKRLVGKIWEAID